MVPFVWPHKNWKMRWPKALDGSPSDLSTLMGSNLFLNTNWKLLRPRLMLISISGKLNTKRSWSKRKSYWTLRGSWQWLRHLTQKEGQNSRKTLIQCWWWAESKTSTLRSKRLWRKSNATACWMWFSRSPRRPWLQTESTARCWDSLTRRSRKENQIITLTCTWRECSESIIIFQSKFIIFIPIN